MRKAILILGIVFIISGMGYALEDPLEIGVTARPMGMGKAFVAIADDGSSVFLNPSGIAGVDYWSFTSMYTKLLGDVYYFATSLSYPINFRGLDGSLAIGYVGSGVDQLIVPTSTGIEFFYYHSNVLLLSSGLKLTPDLMIGGNLKYFSKGFVGAVTNQGHGWDIDLGIKYSWTDHINLGLAVQNVVPLSMGGKVVWDNGLQEGIPVVLKPGIAFKTGSTTYALDVEYTRTYPTLLHVGIEHALIKNYFVRLGMDQVVSASQAGGVASMPTFGLGLNLYGFRVDYAYHPYHDETGNVTHYVSFSNVPPDKPDVKMEPVEEIIILKPSDNTLTYEVEIPVSGTLENVVSVMVAGEKQRITRDGFNTIVPLNHGRNTIDLEGISITDKLIKRWVAVIRLRWFKDVSEEHWARKPIECLSTAGVILGYPDKTFGGDRGITRAEFVTMIMRAFEDELKPKTASKIFPDTIGHWAELHIDGAVQMKIVKGYPDGKFKPNGHISRAEAVEVITNLENLKREIVVEPPFLDLDITHWAADAVAAAKKAGLLEYMTEDLFAASEPIPRSEVTQLLVRTKFGQDKMYKTFRTPYDHLVLPPHLPEKVIEIELPPTPEAVIIEKGEVKEPAYAVLDTYIVREGDSLLGIAMRYYGDPYKYLEIAEFNNIEDPSDIHAGQKILIPDLKKLEKQEESKKETKKVKELEPEIVFYTIQTGDTLMSVARKFYNDSSKYLEIAEFNKLEDPNDIRVGQKIMVPVKPSP
ncbi:MAG: S-layer homology domain-containing protein [Candidatus Margulisbacteria bacterium]|nr:S-layer homology domain-containing protein [Candidatus Margulisiibacteriota bacterium]